MRYLPSMPEFDEDARYYATRILLPLSSTYYCHLKNEQEKERGEIVIDLGAEEAGATNATDKKAKKDEVSREEEGETRVKFSNCDIFLMVCILFLDLCIWTISIPIIAVLAVILAVILIAAVVIIGLLVIFIVIVVILLIIAIIIVVVVVIFGVVLLILAVCIICIWIYGALSFLTLGGLPVCTIIVLVIIVFCCSLCTAAVTDGY